MPWGTVSEGRISPWTSYPRARCPPGHSVQTVLFSAECPPMTLCRVHKGEASPSLAGAITTKQITAHTMEALLYCLYFVGRCVVKNANIKDTPKSNCLPVFYYRCLLGGTFCTKRGQSALG